MVKNKRRLLLKLLIIFLVLGLFLALINIQVSSKQGLNFVVHTIRMPLYIKAIEFIDRDYQYKQIAKLITKGFNTDEKKVLAIFEWTHKNIRKNIPKDWPIIDDHVWNIIIRGYGTNDQSADVFTTMCVYAGIPAFWSWISPKNSEARLAVSYVKFNEKWLIFDSYHGNYFWNEKGEIASVEDIITNPTLVNRASHMPIFRQIEYVKYFENISPISDVKFLKARKHMPLKRFFYEIKRIISFRR